MWKTYRGIIRQYSKISLQEERQLIRKAKRGSKQAANELVWRHIGFVIFRIHKRAFPAYARVTPQRTLVRKTQGNSMPGWGRL